MSDPKPSNLNPVPAKKSKLRFLTGALGALILLPVVGAAALYATFNPNDYRGEIARFLSDKTGRKVSLNGDVSLRLAGGFALAVKDVSLGNPAWASRPELAKIGELALAVKWQGLLESPRRLDITQITVADADVQLETNAKNEKNWELDIAREQPVTKQPVANMAAPTTKFEAGNQAAATPAQPMAINLDVLTLKNVRLAMLDGKKPSPTQLQLKELVLKARDKTDLKLTGSFNQQPITLAVLGGKWQDFLAKKPWDFTAKAEGMGNVLDSQGQAMNLGKQFDLRQFKLVTSMGSTVTGNVMVNMAGAKPDINGTVRIDKITVPANGATGKTTEQAAAPPADAKPNNQAAGSALFSDKAFDLTPLTLLNAALMVDIGSISANGITLTGTNFNLRLRDGVLNINPFMTNAMGNMLQGRLSVNAANGELATQLRGDRLRLQPVMEKMGYGNYQIGDADIMLDYTARGNSPRALAHSLGGKTLIKIGRSELPTASLNPMVSNLLKLATPGSPLAAQQRITCGIARFNAQNGVFTSNGLLVDTSLATVAGAGTIDLKQEQLKLTFQPQAKDKALGGITAPLNVSGSLTKPVFAVNAQAALLGAAETFLGDSLSLGGVNVAKLAGGGKAALPVPQVNDKAAEPCLDAIDNPTYATGAAPTSAAGIGVDKAKAAVQEKVKNLTDKLGKALNNDKTPPALKNLLNSDQSPLKGLFGQ